MENTLGYVKFELEKTQKALQDYKTRCDKLQQENRLVTEDRERIKTDSEEIIDYLRNTNAAKEKTIEELKHEMGLQKDSLLREKLVVKNNLENQVKDLQTTLLEYEVRVQTLQADIDIVQDFKQQRATMLQDLSSSQQAMEEMTTKSKEKVAKLERKYFEEKVRLQKEVQAKLAEMKKEAEARAVANLAARTRHTLMAHTAERAQQATQNAAISALHDHHARTLDKAEDLRRELELSRSRLKEYAYLTHKQGKEIEGLTKRVKELEAAQSHPRPRSSPSSSSSSSSSSSLQEQLVDSRLDIDSLKRLLNIKTMELRKIRSLAQEIIEQRSDLEQYFHDSLEHVKAEKLRQIQQQQKLNKNTTKSTTQKESEAHKKQQQGDRVKLEDLSWEEKERVLRILFSKINAQQSLPGQDESESDSEDEDEIEARGGFDYDRYYDEMNQRDENTEQQQQQQETIVETIVENNDEQQEDEFELEKEDDNRQNNFPSQDNDDDTNKYFGMVSSGDFPPLA